MYTVRKFHDFSITQILREIKFEDSRSGKSAILTNLGALNLVFVNFCTFFFADYQMAKTAVFSLLKSTKLISRKI